jgi:hypothetical protein
MIKRYDIRPRRKRNGNENGTPGDPPHAIEPVVDDSVRPASPAVAPLTPAGAFDDK